MLNLIGMKNCRMCEASKKLLEEKNIQYKFMDIAESENLEIAKRFKIKVAGKFLYDDEKDEVIPVTDYINSLE